jgi:hypothetical protein
MSENINNKIVVDVEKFWSEGYIWLKNVFSKEEIESYRQRIYESPNKEGDLLSNPRLRGLLLDDRILSIASQILGQTPIYFGESVARFTWSGPGWHRDNVDRDDPKAPDWQGRYTIIKFGIYPQDHSRHSGGLNIREKSHLLPGIDGPPEQVGRNRYMASEPGDVLVWTLRTTHSARGYQLKFPRSIQIEPSPGPKLPHSINWLARMLQAAGINRLQGVPKFLIAPEEKKDRILISMAFGTDDDHFKRYLAWLKTTKFMVKLWQNSKLDQDALDAAKGKHIIIKSYWDQFSKEQGLGLENFDYSYSRK